MKADIHPEYVEATLKCACGYEITSRSTVPSLSVEICSNCHPFYTGKQKLIDSAGRIEKFTRKYSQAREKQEAEKAKKAGAPAETQENAAAPN